MINKSFVSLLCVTAVLSSTVASAQWQPQNNYEYEHEKYTTSDWSPYVKQFHLTTPEQIEIQNVKGGEGYQCVYTAAISSQNPDIMMRGYDTMGIWYSHDKGQSWQQSANCPLFINNITAHPTEGNTFYANAQGPKDHEGGIWKTTDGGVNWTRVLAMNHGATNAKNDFAFGKPDDNGNAPIYFGKSCKFGYKTYSADFGEGDDSEAGLWKSTDNGATWQRIAFFDNYIDQVWADDESDTVIVTLKSEKTTNDAGETLPTAVTNNVRISYDGGATWQTYNNGLLADKRVRYIAVNPENKNNRIGVLYPETGAKPVLYESFDAGATWTKKSVTWNGGLNNDCVLEEIKWTKKNSAGEQTMIALFNLNNYVIRISHDGGATWDKFANVGEGFKYSTSNSAGDNAPYEDWYKLAVAVTPADPDLIMTGSGISYDGGKTSQWCNSGISGLACYDIEWDKEGNPQYFGGADIGMLRTVYEYNGKTYQGSFKPAREILSVVHNRTTAITTDPNDEKHSFAILGGGADKAVIAETKDGFDTATYHTALSQYATDKVGNSTMSDISYHPLDSNLIISNRWISENNGVTWRMSDKYIHTYSPFDSNVMYSFTYDSTRKVYILYISKDRAKTWQQTGFKVTSIDTVKADKHTDGVLWVGTHLTTDSRLYRIDVNTGEAKVMGDENGLKVKSDYGLYLQHFDQSPVNKDWLAISATDQFGYYNDHYISFDGGDTWYSTAEYTNVPHYFSCHMNEFHPTKNELWTGSHYGIIVIQFDELVEQIKSLNK